MVRYDEAMHDLDFVPENRLQSIVVPKSQTKYSTLLLNGSGQYRYDITLTDMQGRVVVDLQDYVNDWSMSGLSPGIYVYHIRYRDQQHTGRLESGKLVITEQ
jgi:hypothetical protein